MNLMNTYEDLRITLYRLDKAKKEVIKEKTSSDTQSFAKERIIENINSCIKDVLDTTTFLLEVGNCQDDNEVEILLSQEEGGK
jgi:hypothetical protein